MERRAPSPGHDAVEAAKLVPATPVHSRGRWLSCERLCLSPRPGFGRGSPPFHSLRITADQTPQGPRSFASLRNFVSGLPLRSRPL